MLDPLALLHRFSNSVEAGSPGGRDPLRGTEDGRLKLSYSQTQFVVIFLFLSQLARSLAPLARVSPL